jgi:acyl-CoA thioesterase-1
MGRAIALLLGAFLLTACTHKTAVSGGDIVYLGDSITAGYGLDPGEAYPTLITIPGMTSVNLGVSGSNSADGLQRLRTWFADGKTPQIVVIALGANDILHNSTEDTEANLNSAIAECKNHGAAVLLCGVKIPFKSDTASIFEHVASKNHVPLVPDILFGEAFQPDLLQEDHAHPTAEGQKIIAGKLQAELLKDFAFQTK